MLMRVGSTLVRTTDRGGRIAIPSRWIEGAGTLVGARVEELFHHRSTADQRYTVASTTLDPTGTLSLIDFIAEPIEWRVPWARPGFESNSSDPD